MKINKNAIFTTGSNTQIMRFDRKEKFRVALGKSIPIIQLFCKVFFYGYDPALFFQRHYLITADPYIQRKNLECLVSTRLLELPSFQNREIPTWISQEIKKLTIAQIKGQPDAEGLLQGLVLGTVLTGNRYSFLRDILMAIGNPRGKIEALFLGPLLSALISTTAGEMFFSSVAIVLTYPHREVYKSFWENTSCTIHYCFPALIILPLNLMANNFFVASNACHQLRALLDASINGAITGISAATNCAVALYTKARGEETKEEQRYCSAKFITKTLILEGLSLAITLTLFYFTCPYFFNPNKFENPFIHGLSSLSAYGEILGKTSFASILIQLLTATFDIFFRSRYPGDYSGQKTPRLRGQEGFQNAKLFRYLVTQNLPMPRLEPTTSQAELKIPDEAPPSPTPMGNSA